MEKINIISQPAAILLTLIISISFVVIGVIYSKKYRGINNYLVANRSIGFFSLTTSFVASALGTWILFGPASAATWGGLGSVIGYSIGTAFPLLILIYLGKKFRKLYPKGKTFIEIIRARFGLDLFKLNAISFSVILFKEKIFQFLGKFFLKDNKQAEGMMEMEPTPVETFQTKIIDDYVWIGIDQSY